MNARNPQHRPVIGAPDLKQARVFLRMLDPERTEWEFRTFDDVTRPDGSGGKDPRLTMPFRGTLDKHAGALQHLNARGAGVFFTANRTDGKGRSKKNVTEVVAFFADTDGAPLEPLLALKPHICLQSSPGKYHVYWRVSDCPLDQFKPVQQAIAKKFHTDRNVCDAGRVMRLPGFHHNKHEPTLVTFVPAHMDARHKPYTLAEVIKGLGLTLAAPGSRPAPALIEGLGANLGSNTDLNGGAPPPPVETIRAMLTHLAERGYFKHRSGVEKDEAGRIIGLGWLETGMALKAAYDDKGFDLWALTHEDDEARADAPAQWASFSSEYKSGHVTVGSIIRAAKDADFPMRVANANAPPSEYVSFGAFTMDAGDGLTKEATVGRGQNATVETQWIAAPFEVMGRCRDPHGRGWGKMLRFKDGDARVHALHVTDAELHGEPAALCAKLADNGLTINRERQRELAAYLSSVKVSARVTVVNRTGWHAIGGVKAFVLPAESIGADDDEAVALDAVAHGPYASAGALEDWKRGVGRLTSGHVLPVLGVSAALAGPLAQLVEAEGGGVHLVGSSSSGKSTVLAAGASVWGRGETRGGFIRSWRSTANGLEGLAASSTDTCLVLDELGVGDGREVSAAVYGLANGLGKARAARDGAARDPRSWRVFLLSSGEISIATKIGEDRGRATKAGQAVRLLDIPADAGKGYGAFDSPGAFNHAGELADSIKAAACGAYGTAGPEFVRRIITHGVERVVAAAKNRMAEFVAKVVSKEGGDQVRRAAKKFALIAVAGELATALGVTPWEKGEARRAAEWAFARWLEQRGGGGSHEARQAVEQVRLMIEQHGEARFESAEGSLSPVRDRLGWRKGEGAAREWWVPVQTWKSEICDGLDPTFVARTLDAQGMLRRQDTKNLASVVAVGDQRIRAYVLTVKILCGGEG